LDVPIPTLKQSQSKYRMARVCQPTSSSRPKVSKDPLRFPLHIWAHGNGGGGRFLAAYDSLQEQIASYGFVVAAFASCWFDSACDQGESQWLETVKTIQYFEENSQIVTFNKGLNIFYPINSISRTALPTGLETW
jgi:hypothetical protein